MTFYLDSEPLNFRLLNQVLAEMLELELTDDAWQRIDDCRQFLNQKLNQSDDLYYGINTGFGALCNVRISKPQIEELQRNLVMSHACGIGDIVPAEIIRLMLLLKVKSLAAGHSGAHPNTVRLLLELYNRNILPVVYEQGSLGASGDLAPLAHLSLPLLGLGEVIYNGEIVSAEVALRAEGLQTVVLQSKEGLALLNGTQFMSAYGCINVLRSRRLMAIANLTVAMSLEAFLCRSEPFHPLIHQVRPFKGQVQTAEKVLRLLRGSRLINSFDLVVQDPYSFRCIPQVHGASADVLDHVESIFETEINSVTDNPNIFPEEEMILSGGNFHGQPLALALDYLAMAMAEMGNISERRTFKLVSGERELPPFLIGNPGLHSGLMIPQYTAASIVSLNKQLCTPASVDSITSSNGQEDHVSMGANAAVKTYKVIENVERVLAIEFMVAAQALEFRDVSAAAPAIREVFSVYRTIVPFNAQDRVIHNDIVKTVNFLKNYPLPQ